MRKFGMKARVAAVAAVLMLAAAIFGVMASAESEGYGPPEIGEYIQIYYDDGLLSNEANTILFAENGYIWIGSYSGLSRYDSNSIVTYGDDENSIMNGISVRVLFEDSSNRLWIGSNDKGVFLHEDGEFTAVDISAAGISGSIRGFAQTEQGIYVASTGGLALIREDFSVEAVSFEGIGVSTVSDLITDNKGRLWVIDHDSLTIVDASGEQKHYDTTGYTQSECNCMTLLNDGRVMIGTNSQDIIYVTDIGTDFALKSAALKGCTTINHILEDMYGRIWICDDNGLGYIEKGKFCWADCISFTSIEQIEQDYEGNLWLASSRQGVLELVRGKFNSKSTGTDLEGLTVNATQMYEDLLFVAADSGLVVVDPETFETVEHPMSELLKGVRTRGLFTDSKGNLWITTYVNYGVIRYKNGEYVSINAEKGLTSNKTRVTMELANGDIAVSTGGGVNIIRDDKVIKTYTEKDGLENPVILSMCTDKIGNMYFGSDGNGIYVVGTDGTVSCYDTDDGLDSGVILNLKHDEKSRCVWISTGSNIAVWDENGIRNLNDFKAGVGSIFDIIFINDNVWVLRNTSVIIATREQLFNGASSSELTVLGRKDGLLDITSNSRHCIDKNGTMYLATSSGVYTINTEALYQSDVSHQAIINSVTVDGVVYNNPESLVLPSDTSRITIDFSALNYSTDTCQVEYQLVGADEEPIVVSGDRNISRDYTNLGGGTYLFRVSVINSSGQATESAVELTIKKQLALYERWYFVLGVVILSAALLATLVYYAVQIRTTSLLRQQERYRSLTESAMKVAARSIDAKDSYTNGHSTRVAILSREIARHLGWSDEDVENVYFTALVHDIGKIGVPDSLLTKPSALTEEEYQIIRTHTTTGYNILREFKGVPNIGLGARYHHERWDGNGYCEGLAGEDIPMIARIIAVADAYDAMASSRVYRPRLEPEKIRSELENGKGTQFDPEIASIMLKMLDEGFDPFSIEAAENRN